MGLIDNKPVFDRIIWGCDAGGSQKGLENAKTGIFGEKNLASVAHLFEFLRGDLSQSGAMVGTTTELNLGEENLLVEG